MTLNIYLHKKPKCLCVFFIVSVCLLVILSGVSFQKSFKPSETTSYLYNPKSQLINPLQVHLDKPLLFNPGHAICPDQQSPVIIAFMIIGPNLVEKRTHFRQLLKSTTAFRLVFVVGLSKEPNVNDQLYQEFFIYKDLLVGDFTDSYFNMSTKIMMSFKWVDTYCPQASFTLRLNDDINFNVTELVHYFQSEKDRNVFTKNTIICPCDLYDFKYSCDRRPQMTFYVSWEQWNYNGSLPYCGGDAYALSMDMNRKYYEANLRYYQPPFSVWLEDVLIGILTRQLNATIVHHKLISVNKNGMVRNVVRKAQR